MIEVIGRIQRNIAIIMIAVIAAVCCACFDLSIDISGSGGSLKGSSSISISHSLIADAPSAIRKDNGNNSQGQSFNHADPTSHIFTRIIRKLLVIIGGLIPAGSRAHFSHYYLSLCATSCAYLFLLTHVRFIHLKDGSK